MRCVLSYPGVMDHAQHAALSLLEAGMLHCFVTSFVFDENSCPGSALSLLPRQAADKLRRELNRRSVDRALLPRTRSYAGWEVLRTIVERAGAGRVWTDRVWDIGAHRFDRTVAARHVKECDVILAFEYTARATFETAARLGRARVLHLASLENRAFRALELRQKAQWPELRTRSDGYFDRKFERRQARREREIELAEIIIVNSSLTKRSHIAAGADPNKIFVVPFGSPPPLPEVRSPTRTGEPLRVLWSGSFILRKGATYLIEAWRLLAPGRTARLDIYGHLGVPAAVTAHLPEGVTLHGSVPRARMLDAYEHADVLVFPTLSDGFGMVVTEALSRGLPVITTDHAGASDLIDHGRNGLIVPAADADALADALRWCLDNRAQLAEMRHAALATAKRRQWSDYRRDHVAALRTGLERAGFQPASGSSELRKIA